jgi:lysyl-tRNA synthetase class 2
MDEENELIALRRKKLDALRAKGVDPFGSGFDVTGSIADVREKFKEGETFRIAGRITAHRDMGKSHFLDLRDATGRIQIYIHAKEVGAELTELFRLLDLGDFLGAEGTCFVTKSGEPTLKVRTFQLLAKALRPLPEKWHGLQDIESRYRQRYLDLITNERSRAVFEKRAIIMRETRRFLEERGFVEVETPILQTIPGGAAAEPFVTHHNALGLDLYLRIALELYLNVCWWAALSRSSKLIVTFATKESPESTIPNLRCSKPTGRMPIGKRLQIWLRN